LGALKTGKPLNFQRPDQICDPLHSVLKAPPLQPIDNLLSSAGVPEIQSSPTASVGHPIFRIASQSLVLAILP
jgi:hypothetical protein